MWAVTAGIAFHLNAGRSGDVMEGGIDSALAELLEWRTALMQALGYERNRHVTPEPQGEGGKPQE